MKNTFKFEFHMLYYLVGLFCLFTGYFKDFIWISLLIIVHECGHVTGAILWDCKIERVVILPFGGMTYLKEDLNRPIKQEWWIVLLGPIYQMLFFLILYWLGYTHSTFTTYHFLLLSFNLLPIIPLDGSKMLQLCLESFCSYFRAKYIAFFLSVMFLFILGGYVICARNLLFGVILVFIIKENWTFYRNIPYIMTKFLLERYLHPLQFQKQIQIPSNNLKKMRRGYKHLFLQNGSWKTEYEMLQHYFKKGITFI